MTILKLKLVALDAFLTQKTLRETEQTASHQGCDVFSIRRNTYYLSDGGYSRICIHHSDEPMGDCSVFLDSVSLPKTKERWYLAQNLVDEVQRAAETEYHEAGW